MASAFTGNSKEIEARGAVSQEAVEQLSLINSYRVQEGQPPHQNLYDAAQEMSASGDRAHAKYLHELNKQNNHAKHNFTHDLTGSK